MKYYAGIGSRATPSELKSTIIETAKLLSEKGYTLRSGGADGADNFFEEGADSKEIYLPWQRFNNNDSELYGVGTDAMELAKKYHPRWDKLSTGVKLLIARNGYQVLGEDLETPVEFIICWTPNGGVQGGTGQALRIAKDLKIPIFNLQKPEALQELMTHINKTRLF